MMGLPSKFVLERDNVLKRDTTARQIIKRFASEWEKSGKYKQNMSALNEWVYGKGDHTICEHCRHRAEDKNVGNIVLKGYKMNRCEKFQQKDPSIPYYAECECFEEE